MGSIRTSTILAGLLCLALGSIHCKSDRNKGGEAVEGSGTAAKPDGQTSLSQAVSRRGRAVQVKLQGAGSCQAGDHLDLVAVITDPKTELQVALTFLQNVILLQRDGDRLSLMVLPEEAEILALSENLGQVWAVLRNPQDTGIQVDRIRTTLSALLRGGPPTPEAQLVPSTGPSLNALPHGQRALEILAQGSAGVLPGDRVDLLALLPDGGDDDQMVTTVLEDVPVLARSGDRLVLGISAILVERTVMAASLGKLTVSRRAPASRHRTSEWLPATIEQLITGTTKSRMQSLRQTALQGISGLTDLARLPDPLRAITLSVDGASTVTPGDRLDLLATFVDPKTKQAVTLTLLDNLITLGASGDQLTLVVMPLEAQMAVLAGAIGQLKASLRNLEDTAIEEGRARATIETLITGERIKALNKKRDATIQIIRMPGGGGPSGPSGPEAAADRETWKPSTIQANTSRLMIGDEDSLPLKQIRLRAQVDGFRARILMDLFFENDRERQLEGNFQLRLPDGASPYFLAFGQSTMRLDQLKATAARAPADPITPDSIVAERAKTWLKPKVARMVQRERASMAYGDTVRARVDPALMEWSGAGVFSARVFPLVPGKLHQVVIGYDMDLTRLGDDLELLLGLPSDVPSKRVDLHIAEIPGVRITVEPAVELVSADGRANARIDKPGQRVLVKLSGVGDSALTGIDPATGPFFAAQLSPNLPSRPSTKKTRRAIFLVDTSMSAGADHFPIFLEILQSVLEQNRSRIPEFAVLFFNVEHFWWHKGWKPNTPQEVQALLADANRMALEGATDLEAALLEATRPKGWRAGVPLAAHDLFLLSDGGVTWGQAEATSLARLLRAHPDQSAAVFAYRTGMPGQDTGALGILARETGGAVFTVAGRSEIAKAARAHNNRPWELVRIDLPGASDLLLSGGLRTLYPGQRIVLTGRGTPKAKAAAVMTVRQGGTDKKVSIRLPTMITSELTARTYGQIAVERLEEWIDEARPQVEAYARHFRVTGKACSLLMLESESDYRRFNIRPENDSVLIRDRPVSALIAKLLDRIADSTRSARSAVLAFLDHLADIPGAHVRLDKSIRSAIEALPEASFQVPRTPLTCKQHFWTGVPNKVKQDLIGQQPGYESLVSEADRREKVHGPADALKALSSLVEARPGDGVLALDVGHSALRWGLAGHAFRLFEGVAKSRPYEPQAYLAMARSLAELGQDDLALMWYEVALAGKWDPRFGAFKKVALLDYLDFLSAQDRRFSAATADLAQTREKKLRHELGMKKADLVVVISWNTDGTDVDLHVVEPSGEECFYSHPGTKSGGELSQDVTMGYGPEVYVLPEAPKGTYHVRAKYFASNFSRTSTRTKVFATVYRDWGSSRQKISRHETTLKTGKDMHDLVKVEVP